MLGSLEGEVGCLLGACLGGNQQGWEEDGCQQTMSEGHSGFSSELRGCEEYRIAVGAAALPLPPSKACKVLEVDSLGLDFGFGLVDLGVRHSCGFVMSPCFRRWGLSRLLAGLAGGV